MNRVILASASPRRQELLRKLISEFEVIPAHLDEDALTDPDPWVTAQRLAREKGLAVWQEHPEALVIAGDTVVALPMEGGGYTQYAKPIDKEDAHRMLRELAGKEHVVITGVAIIGPGTMSAFTETSWVRFSELTDDQIQAYIETGEPMDKAGSYGIQGMARFLIAELRGSVENVIGLPIERLDEALKQAGIRLPKVRS